MGEDQVTVIQADREAAAAITISPELAEVLRGAGMDDHTYVRAFARHRQAHTPYREAGLDREAVARMREALWKIERNEDAAYSRDLARAALTSPTSEDAGEVEASDAGTVLDEEQVGAIQDAEKMAVVAWLREQSDKGADIGIEAEKGSTRRAAYGGGSYALKRAADMIEADEHLTAANPKPEPVETQPEASRSPVSEERATVPEGWVLIPTDPTDEELDKAIDEIAGPVGCCSHDRRTMREAWEAVIAATGESDCTCGEVAGEDPYCVMHATPSPQPQAPSEERAREVLAQTLESHQLNSSAYYVRDTQGVSIKSRIVLEAMIRFATDTQPVAGGGDAFADAGKPIDPD